MAPGRGPCSDTNWDNEGALCRTAVAVDQDMMAMDLFGSDSHGDIGFSDFVHHPDFS
jgi:hypothetical protein